MGGCEGGHEAVAANEKIWIAMSKIAIRVLDGHVCGETTARQE